AQLVDGNTRLINTMTKDKMWTDIEGVKEKFGVPPEKIIDYLALRGDKIDNVPGIPNCGEVTAGKLIKEYGSVESIIENAANIKGRIGNNIRDNLAFLPIAKSLVTIRTDVDISADVPNLEVLKQKPIDKKALYDFYSELEFRTWANKIKKEIPADQLQGATSTLSASPDKENEPITGVRVNQANIELPELPPIVPPKEKPLTLEEFEKLHQSHELATMYLLIDGDEQQSMTPSGLVVMFSEGRWIYFSGGMNGLISEEGRDIRAIELAKAWLEDPKSPKYCYDAKKLAHALQNIGISLNGVEEDVLIQNYILEAHRNHALEKITANWLKVELREEALIIGKGAGKKRFCNIATSTCMDFSLERASAVYRLAKVFQKALADQPALDNIYRNLEMPVMKVLFIMEQNGVLIDSAKLDAYTQELAEKAAELESKAFKEAGQKFNLGSPKQLGEILFDKLDITIDGKKPKKTLSGGYSTNEEVLTALKDEYPLAELALEYRTISKLMTTYTEKLPKLVSPKDGRVHTTFEQTVPVTGRLSSANPNLQNIPARHEGKRIREAFIASSGCKIVSADYSQIELRLMAHFSGDEAFMSAFKNNIDIHRATAAEVFNEPLEKVTDDQRRTAKVINFGLIYGMSPFGLAKSLGIDRHDAKEYITRYFNKYPGVRDYIESSKEQAHANGYVTTLYGRKLEVPDLKVPGARNNAAERQAINAPLQGTAADLIKRAMINVQAWLDEEKLKSKLILQVHDELIIEAPDNEVDIVKKKLPEIMAAAGQLDVPLIAQVGVGDNWEAAH
ncbi:MAG: DNA polymerase I, partial [Burkholderiales bacterium]|nr:DNA polymerase I [Burkholderiales bacterium]